MDTQTSNNNLVSISVEEIKNIHFLRLKTIDKIRIKIKGLATPEFGITQEKSELHFLISVVKF